MSKTKYMIIVFAFLHTLFLSKAIQICIADILYSIDMYQYYVVITLDWGSFWSPGLALSYNKERGCLLPPYNLQSMRV